MHADDDCLKQNGVPSGIKHPSSPQAKTMLGFDVRCVERGGLCGGRRHLIDRQEMYWHV